VSAHRDAHDAHSSLLPLNLLSTHREGYSAPPSSGSNRLSFLKPTSLQAICVRLWQYVCLPQLKIDSRAALDRVLSHVYKSLAQSSRFFRLSYHLLLLFYPYYCLLLLFLNYSQPQTSWLQELLTIPNCTFALKYLQSRILSLMATSMLLTEIPGHQAWLCQYLPSGPMVEDFVCALMVEVPLCEAKSSSMPLNGKTSPISTFASYRLGQRLKYGSRSLQGDPGLT
jgi:hypothetical protein